MGYYALLTIRGFSEHRPTKSAGIFTLGTRSTHMQDELRVDDLKNNWDLIKEKMKTDYDISSVAFNTWIQPLEIYNVSKDQVIILVTNWNKRFMIDYLTKRYSDLIQITIEEVLHARCRVTFILPDDLDNDEIINDKKKLSPEMDNYYKASLSANLNPKYTFETFVVGPNNKFAHAAALAVADSPAARYNPLFIYGGVGLGKTHLMHSIAHQILHNNPSLRVLYVTSEKFTSELIEAIRSKNNAAFKDKYRNIDVLLIDDIQFIIGKESTQEEFFHTFNNLYENNKQIVISSDKPPKEFTTLEERLSSRFAAGLSVDISSPDYETRMAVLRKKEEMEHYTIDEAILKYIATNVTSNIRELEGALTKVIAYAKLSNCELTMEMAEEALKDIIHNDQNRVITSQLIMEVVAEHFGFQTSDLISHKRNKEIAYPRQITMYLCREMTGLSLQQIGKDLGNRDHTTIRHGCEKIADELKSDVSLRETIEVIQKKISPSSTKS